MDANMMISRPPLKEVLLASLSGEVIASEVIPDNGSVKNLNEVLKNVGYVITEGTHYVKDDLKTFGFGNRRADRYWLVVCSRKSA